MRCVSTKDLFICQSVHVRENYPICSSFVAVCLCISSSQLDCLDLVVDFEVKRVEVADEGVFHEWAVGGHIVLLSRFEICVKLVPFLVEIVTFCLVLLNAERLLQLRLHFQ